MFFRGEPFAEMLDATPVAMDEFSGAGRGPALERANCRPWKPSFYIWNKEESGWVFRPNARGFSPMIAAAKNRGT